VFKCWWAICDILAYGAKNKCWPTWWRRTGGLGENEYVYVEQPRPLSCAEWGFAPWR